MSRYLMVVLIALPACTAEMQDGKMQSEFHMPLTYAAWQTKKTADSCVVTSGYRGVDVIFHKGKVVSAASNRALTPGDSFSINVNGHHYETYQTAFSHAATQGLAQDFLAADKAYTRLIRSGMQNAFDDNILRLSGFAEKAKECQAKPAKPRKAK